VLLGLALAGVVLSAVVLLGAAAWRNARGTGSLAGSLPFLAPRVELQLAPYLQTLRSAPFDLPDPRGRQLAQAVRTFYQRRGNEPAWFVDGRLRPEASELLELLAGLDDEGLRPRDYRVDALAAELERIGRRDGEPGAAERLEVGLTWAALLAASHLRHGRLTPDAVGASWQIAREGVDLPAVLAEALESGRLAATLRRLDPVHPQFAGLLKALHRYREIAAQGGWPSVPRGPVLQAGEQGNAERLRALARRLQAEGFLAEIPPELMSPSDGDAAPSRLVYSRPLAEAVARFQRTRTLVVDGNLGEATQEELDVPLDRRLQQIVLNLERWRWVPDQLGARAVLVNIPGYTLDVEENGRVVESMAVVVGEEGWETPVFSDHIEHVVVNPYWNVPASILRDEVLPALQADPFYLASHDMEVVRGETDAAERVSDTLVHAAAEGGDYRVRQRPGKTNPLGQLKLMFPNEHNVYLHDTPADHLFAEPDRSASHGCIRVERPIDLAARLLHRSGWTPERLRATIASGRTDEIPLDQPTPVFLLYFTAAVRPDGALELYEDIYGVDAAHARARAAA
jgi:murein L,D-transpeptidase YcbB/YkuD